MKQQLINSIKSNLQTKEVVTVTFTEVLSKGFSSANSFDKECRENGMYTRDCGSIIKVSLI